MINFLKSLLKTPYRMGYKAFTTGAECPFSIRSKQHAEWSVGYMDAMFDGK